MHPEFAHLLKETALAYPFNPPKRIPVARALQFEGGTYLLAGREAFLLENHNPEEGEGEPRSLAGQEPFPLTPSEAVKSQTLPSRRFPLSEDELQKSCIEAAWSYGRRLSRRTLQPEVLRTAPFQGYLGRGIHWRKTISAWIDGAPPESFFVKLPARSNVITLEADRQSDQQRKPCPVVWMFTPGAMVQSRVSGTFSSDVYSSFYWLASSRSMASGCIVQERVAFCVNILRGRVLWEPDAVRHFLETLPRRFQPAAAPWYDPELTRFKGPDLAVATGIKYADDRIIVVADSTFVFGRNLQDYAQSRSPEVEIVRLPWSGNVFPWEARRRLALQHTVPSPRFGDPDPRLLAQIPPVPKLRPNRL